MYPGIVNVDSKSKDNSEEQYTFIQNHMHTQELDNDEDDEEYENNGCASSDHEHGKHNTDDEEYESDHFDNSDNENRGHKNDDQEYEMDRDDISYDEDEEGGNKMDENDMVISTLFVSPSGSISTKETGNIMTESSKVDLRLDTVHKLGKKLVMVESNGEFILYCLMRSLHPHQKTVTVQGRTVLPNLCTHGGKSTVGQYVSILQSYVLDPNKDSFLTALQLFSLKKEIDTDYMEEELKDLKELGEEMYSMRDTIEKICKLTKSMQFILCTHEKKFALHRQMVLQRCGKIVMS